MFATPPSGLLAATRVTRWLSRRGAALAWFLAALAVSLGFAAPASAAAGNLVYMSGNSSLNTPTDYQTPAEAAGLTFIDGSSAWLSGATLPIDADTKVVVIGLLGELITTPIPANSVAQLASIMKNRPDLAVVLNVETCCAPEQAVFPTLLQAVEPAGWNVGLAAATCCKAPQPLEQRTATLNPASPLAAYFSSLPQFATGWYSPMTNVPTDYALYVNTDTDAGGATTSPATSNAVTLVIPWALSSNGGGACVILSSDASQMADDSGSTQGEGFTGPAVATAFVNAALDPHGVCAYTPQPTIAVTMTPSSTLGLNDGDAISYAITVSNAGITTAANVTVTDALPPGINASTPDAWTCASTPDGLCPRASGASGNGALDETLASLSPGQSVTFTLSGTAPSALDTVTNTVSVTGDGILCASGGDTSNPPCTAAASNPADAHMAVTQKQPATPALDGQQVTLTTICANQGPNAARNPACDVDTSGIPASASPQTTCAPDPLPSALNANGRIVCTTTFTPTQPGNVTVNGSTGSDTADSGPAADHFSSLSVTVNPAAALEVTQTSSPAVAGQQATVTTTCKNTGPDAAANATCAVDTSAIPAGANPQTTCAPATSPVGSLAAGDSIVCTTTFTPQSPGTLTMAASADSDTPDLTPANRDAKSITIPVLATATTAAPIPALGGTELVLLALLLGVSALAVNRHGC